MFRFLGKRKRRTERIGEKITADMDTRAEGTDRFKDQEPEREGTRQGLRRHNITRQAVRGER